MTIHDNWQVVGLRGSGSNDVSVENVFVPESITWPRLDRVRGMRRRGGPIFLLGLPGSVSNEHAAFALGVAQALARPDQRQRRCRRGAAAAPPPSRSRTGPPSSASSREAELKLRAARLVTVEVHEQAWQIVCTGAAPEPQLEAEMRASAVLCTEVAVEIATQAFRFAGGSRPALENKLQMCLRDANAGAQHFAVSDVAYENLGQFYLDLPEANAYY